jgi:DNA-binding beta-propeller fold protein YncE
VFVVNNGSSYQAIDGSLTYFDYTTGEAKADIYKMANGKSLGGTPNDVIVYGQKVYVVGSDENTIFVMDVRNCKELKLVSTTELLGDAEGHTPRCIAAYGDKVYFTTYGGYVAAIDTINFTLMHKYQVGSYPEGLAFDFGSAQPKLYVANSDWSMGNGSISCIDLASSSVTEIKIDNVKYPHQIYVSGTGTLYVLDLGQYDELYNQKDAGVYMVSGNNASLVVPNATGMTACGNYIFTYNDPWGGSGPTYSVYDIQLNHTTTLYLSGDAAHTLISPCAIGFDSCTGYIYIASRQLDPDTGYPNYNLPGFVNVYTDTGQFLDSFDTGVEPHKIEFYHGTAKIIY